MSENVLPTQSVAEGGGSTPVEPSAIKRALVEIRDLRARLAEQERPALARPTQTPLAKVEA